MKASSAVALLPLLAGCASTTYLARVNGDEITGVELNQEFRRHHMALDKVLGKPADIEAFLQKAIDRRLLIQEAYRMDLATEQTVRDRMAEFRATTLRNALVKDEILTPSKATDDEIRAAWSLLDKKFEVRQLVVERREDAEALRARIAAGEDFDAIARQRSIAPSSKWGGAAVLSCGDDPARDAALLALKEGETSPVFRSTDGWEFVRLEKRIAVPHPRFSTVDDRLRTQIEARKRRAREETFYAELWKRWDARALDCDLSAAGLRKAAADGSTTPCATWRGGTLEFGGIARRIDLDGLAGLQGAAARDAANEIVQRLLDERLLEAEAEARGYGARPDVVREVRDREEELIEKKLFADYVYRSIDVTGDEARAYFAAHRAEFAIPASFSVAQIAVENEETAKLVQRKLAEGVSFADLAREYSKDPRNATKGGYIGAMSAKELTGPFAAVTKLTPGEVSAPIPSKRGFHIVKVLEMSPERPAEFAAVQEDARRRALQEKRDARRDEWLKRLREAARIRVSRAGIEAYAKHKDAELAEEDRRHAAESKREADQRAEDERIEQAEIAKLAAAEKATTPSAPAPDGDASPDATSTVFGSAPADSTPSSAAAPPPTTH